MKKSILLLSVLALFLGACSTKNGVAMKRKYTNGYYVSIKQKQHHVETKETIARNKSQENEIKPITPTLTSLSSQQPQPQLYASIKNNEVAKKSIVKNNTSGNEHATAIVSKITTNNRTNKVTASEKHTAAKQSSKTANNSDANTVVLVILCLFPFINLIAIYLKDGKSFTMNFWLDLILDILFFLPGIIFALLVVLDVVN